MFAGFDPAIQDSLLRRTIVSLPDIEKQFEEMVSAWRNGEAEHVARLLNKHLAGLKEVSEEMLYRRNENWVRQIVELAKREEDVLVVVGTGHLVGEHSVVALLAERGLNFVQL